jgi:uncharacterized RDD family membrane protein YckC
MQGAAGRAEDVAEQGLLATGTEGTSLREMVAQRVAAHRGRRADARALDEQREEAMRHNREALARDSRHGMSAVRESVRARYEKSQSYRDFLAVEATRALEQAQAEAEVAARKARAVAEAQMQLLQEMEQWNQPEPGPREQAIAEYRTEIRAELAGELTDIALGARELIAEPASPVVEETADPVSGELFREDPSAAKAEVAAGGLTVRLYEDFSVCLPAMSGATIPARAAAIDGRPSDPNTAAMELEELEQEIEFRRSPEFVDHVFETQPLPANLIQFPRQLIAPRKARPRLAEGPLREELMPQPQLRIFEVEPEQISTEPSPVEDVAADAPEWQSLVLGSTPVAEPIPQRTTAVHGAQTVNIASIELRLMAAAVDGICIGSAFLAFVAAVAFVAGPGLRAMSLPMLTGSAVGALLASALIYQLLFFTFAEATPGMRYAHIGLCTFTEENPSRKAMRRRILATILAACPLGLGLLWVCMDDEQLGWHDRMSRMYQRAY